MSTELAPLFDRACAALIREELDEVRAEIEAARAAKLDPNDPRLGYLVLMSEWLDRDRELDAEGYSARAVEVLKRAVELPSPADAGLITLDLSDLLAELGEFDESEIAVRKLCERPDLSPEVAGEGRLLWAQLLLDHHEDPEEAGRVLDGVAEPLRQDPGYVSLRAAVMVEIDHLPEAIALLEAALEQEDEIELRYQLGVALRLNDQEERALEQLLEVRRRDLNEFEVELGAELSASEVQDLTRQLEDLMDTLPNPALAHLGSAKIEVARWVSEEQVRAGTDPRSTLAFTATPGEGDAKPVIQGITVFRDAVIAQVEDDEEITEALVLGLVEELARVVGIELIPGD